MQEEVDRLSRLVGGLLTLARADAEVSVERRQVKLQPLLGEVVDQMRIAAAGRGVTLDLEAPGDLVVLASEDALKQLFLNLIDNAVRYTDSGGRAWVSAAVDGGQVRVEVGDTGIGIEEEERGRIFDRFYRGSTARGGESRGRGPGTGDLRPDREGPRRTHRGHVHRRAALGNAAARVPPCSAGRRRGNLNVF